MTSLYLSRIQADLHNRQARTDLGDLQATHRTVTSLFAGEDELLPNDLQLLWRRDESTRAASTTILIQSTIPPNLTRLPHDYYPADTPPATRDLAPLLDTFSSGKTFAFRLLANVTRKIDTKTAADGTKRNGRRVPLRQPDQQLLWLQRKAADAGFTIPHNSLGVPDVVSVPQTRAHGRRRTGTITIETVRFDGRLTIDDPALFREALISGVGPAKAYGCGLLSLAPPRATTEP